MARSAFARVRTRSLVLTEGPANRQFERTRANGRAHLPCRRSWVRVTFIRFYLPSVEEQPGLERREDTERFIEEVRGDDPKVAKYPRIEERELEAGGQSWPIRTTNVYPCGRIGGSGFSSLTAGIGPALRRQRLFDHATVVESVPKPAVRLRAGVPRPEQPAVDAECARPALPID
jgi:hypothetical protein